MSDSWVSICFLKQSVRLNWTLHIKQTIATEWLLFMCFWRSPLTPNGFSQILQENFFTSACFLAKWPDKQVEFLKRKLQRLQLNCFSPVWIFSWYFKDVIHLNCLSHRLQMYGSFPSWVPMCDSKWCLRRKHFSHTEQLNGFSPLWTDKWCFRLWFDVRVLLQILQINFFLESFLSWNLTIWERNRCWWANLLSHIEQPNGFSPVCTFSWASSAVLVLKALLHSRQMTGFSSECINMWFLSIHDLPNRFLHSLQPNGLCSLWYLLWISNSELVLNSAAQYSQAKNVSGLIGELFNWSSEDNSLLFWMFRNVSGWWFIMWYFNSELCEKRFSQLVHAIGFSPVCLFHVISEFTVVREFFVRTLYNWIFYLQNERSYVVSRIALLLKWPATLITKRKVFLQQQKSEFAYDVGGHCFVCTACYTDCMHMVYHRYDSSHDTLTICLFFNCLPHWSHGITNTVSVHLS